MTRATARVAVPRATPRTTAPRPTPRTSARTAPSRPELRLVPGTAAAGARRHVRAAVAHRRAPFVLLVVALLVGTTLGLLVLNTAIAVDSLKATALKAANTQRAQEVQRLEQQVVTVGTPEQVVRSATAAGMIPAGSAGYLVIGPDGKSTLRGIPAPATRPTATPSGG